MTNNSNTTKKRRGRRRVLQALAWLGATILCYVASSLLFDTPAEHELRHSTDRLKEEYEVLLAEHDSLALVVDNVVERDKNIFAIMFGSEPYNFDSEYNDQRANLQNTLNSKSNDEMSDILESSLTELEKRIKELESSYSDLDIKLQQLGSKRNYIPSIQPVTNHELTLLTATYGTLMHPFYRTLHHHQGVDYAIPEGTRVFATADGVVDEIKGKTSTSGTTVVLKHVIDKHNSYTTAYSHLQSVKVEKGQKVKRGDIIALSGNTGLSLAPHLHYEIYRNGTRVNPIHYFFMELTPSEYQRIIRIAQSSMQSFD